MTQTNEKYKGDILLGKTFTTDPISKRRLKNLGEEDKFYIKEHHEAIISPEVFDEAQEILNRRSLSRKVGRGEKFSRMYTFSSKIKCGFCGGTASRRKWHSGTNHKKDIWQCVTATKSGKKYCEHSKGLEETIIEDAFVIAFNALCRNHKNIVEEFIINVEDALNKESTDKQLKKLNSELDNLENKIKKLVDLQINGIMDIETYGGKYSKLIMEKEKLVLQKFEFENINSSEKSLKESLKSFKEMLDTDTYLTEFDAEVFDNAVSHIVLGGINEDETPNPFLLTFVFKTGYKTSADCNDKKTNGNIKRTTDNPSSALCAEEDIQNSYANTVHYTR